MKILIDLQGAQASNRNRGIGRYSLALAQAIARQAGNHEIWIALSNCFPDSIGNLRQAFDGLLPSERILIWNAPTPVSGIDPSNAGRKKSGEYLREAFLANLRPDIVHVSSLFEGLVDNALTSIGAFDAKLPTAVTLFDLIPLIYRQYYLKNPDFETWYEEKLGHLRRARLWLAISESSRQEGIDWLSLPEDRAINISAAADDRFRPLSIEAKSAKRIRLQYGLSRPFVMYTGGIDLRKNIEGLIGAYARLEISLRVKHQLAIICSADERDIAALKGLAYRLGLMPDDIIFTGYVSDEDMIALYNLCAVFVFPSWHEGFGLPALEAMRCGAAVIAANTSSLPEVIGMPDALFNPHDENEIAEKIQNVLTNKQFRDRLKQHGLSQALKFSWDSSARRAIDGFEAICAYEKNVPTSQVLSPNHHRPSLAYISPLPPEKSGIADYSAELLRELTRYYRIDVVVDQPVVADPWIAVNCTIRSVEWFDRNAGQYDRILYHFGNSSFHQHMFGLLERHPGTVVLHDFYLSGVISHIDYQGYAPGSWVESLYNSHGYYAVKERYEASDAADIIWKYPCSLDVIERANGVVVHSGFSRKMADRWYGQGRSKDWIEIPLLRSALVSKDRSAARDSLGLKDNDFLVCSFGMLGITKLNHRLLMAWLDSPLKDDSSCHLVFVGENHQGRYGAILLHAIERHDCSNRIKITGFASHDLYRTYLAAADVAVQLRTLSRGETSAAVLDCLNYGLPTIVNAHGSIGEISPDAAILLPDQVTQSDLRSALTGLWHDPALRQNLGKAAKSYIKTRHNPWAVGNLYRTAIERFAAVGPLSTKIDLMQSLENIELTPPGDFEWEAVTKAIARNHPYKNQKKKLFLDISELVQRDAKSGIQRVVRNILNELLANPPADFRIEPVYTTHDGIYRYARQFTLNFLKLPVSSLSDQPIEPGHGDVFLALDFCPELIPLSTRAFSEMRNYGTSVFFVLYDLLCVNRPEFFIEGAFEGFDRWLRVVAQHADGVICISKAIADEFTLWLQNCGLKNHEKLKIGWFHLGGDIENSLITEDLSEELDRALETIGMHPSILMVGTIEPRKGYAQALSAFEILWEKGLKVNLIVVGKQGWMVENLIDRMQNHPLSGKHLFWFHNASDSMLQKLYQDAVGCLLASEAEGFGLPLVEAAQHSKPILTRDIPVFKEVAGDHATYFSGTSAVNLAAALETWIDLLMTDSAIGSAKMEWLTWAMSTANLMGVVSRFLKHDMGNKKIDYIAA